MLFNVKIFNVLSETAWRGTDYLFAQCLNYIGHRIYMDTDTVVKITHGPTRHASMEYDEFWDAHREKWERLRSEDRDRRPPPDFDPLKDDGYVDRHGTYFGMMNQVARGKDGNKANKSTQGKGKLWVPQGR